jgi:uncharacterized protein (DUF488 family)
MKNPLFTIGYSNHSLDDFIAMLRGNSVNAVADVRSQPHSKMNPEFSRSLLENKLKRANIAYAFLGQELGARTFDRSCYVNGKVRYDRLAKTPLFQKGLDRVERGANEHRIALMCAEKEPLTCHRCILVSRHLDDRGMKVRHILPNGTTEEHHASMARLITMLGLAAPHMFRGEKESLSIAYEIQGEKIAYERPPIESREHAYISGPPR